MPYRLCSTMPMPANCLLTNESVDLVITSPPYANAIDYMRAHKFSLVWFGEPISELSALRATYIGSDNSRGVIADDLPAGAARCVSEVAQHDHRKARVLQKYLVEMRAALAEMLRVLRTGRAAGIVVGPSTMRGIRVQTQEHLAEISTQTRIRCCRHRQTCARPESAYDARPLGQLHNERDRVTDARRVRHRSGEAGVGRPLLRLPHRWSERCFT